MLTPSGAAYSACSLPPCGGGLGRGGRSCCRRGIRKTTFTSTPNPSPPGGRERAECAAPMCVHVQLPASTLMLDLTLACVPTDRSRPILDGSIAIPGVRIKALPGEPEDIFRRALREEAFDITEMS